MKASGSSALIYGLLVSESPGMTTKQCSKCLGVKELSEFYKNKRGLHGCAAACKQCLTEVYKLHRAQNIDRYTNVRANYRKARKQQFDEYKQTLSCLLCPEDDPACLDFHHLDPNEKDMNVSSMAGSIPWNKLMGEIQKCVVLCSNCHRKLHAGRVCLIKGG